MKFNTSSKSFILILAILSLGVLANAQACPDWAGCLDPTFGTEGKLIVQLFGSNSNLLVPSGMTAQTDGKIVAVASSNGISKLARLNFDGSLDTTFGVGGVASFTWTVTSGSTTYNGFVEALALQNVDGQERIVVAGKDSIQSGRTVIDVGHIERFMPDGSVDTTFGTNGSVIINAGYAQHMAIQSDGKIITLSSTGKLIRQNVDGSLDPTFGSGGIAATAGGSDIAVDTGGGILLGGSVTIGKGTKTRSLMTVKRYTSNGTADAGFGSSGVATADFGYSCSPRRVVIDPFGNIVASARVSVTASLDHAAAARFTSNGLADTSFAGTGKVVLLGPTATGAGFVIQADGKVVLTAQMSGDYGLVRYNYDGSLDSSFGNGGSVVTDVYGSDYVGPSVLQNDPGCGCPKIVMTAGEFGYTSFARFMVQ